MAGAEGGAYSSRRRSWNRGASLGTSALAHVAIIIVVVILSQRVDRGLGPENAPSGIVEDLVFYELAPAPAGAAGPVSAEPPPPPIPNPEIPPLVVPAPDIDITPELAPPLPRLSVPERVGGLGSGGTGQASGGAGSGTDGTGAGRAGTGGGGSGGGTARTAVPLMVLVPPAAPSSVRGGGATLLLHIDETGRVVEVEIIESSGDSNYDRELRATALDWQFRPATHPTLGPVPSVFEISFQF